jgi:hypothetical protein
MTSEEIKESFERHNDEYIYFDRVENKLSQRADLHAFLLLDKLVPDTSDMVCSAEHDEFYLDISIDQLAESSVTDEQIKELIRCGIRISDFDTLCMFA